MFASVINVCNISVCDMFSLKFLACGAFLQLVLFFYCVLVSVGGQYFPFVR